MVRARLLPMSLIASLLILSINVNAQIDPSSGLLLGPGASDDRPTVDSGVESGRYTTRPKATASRRKASAATPTPTPGLSAVTKISVETRSSTGPLAVTETTAAPVVASSIKVLPSVLVDVPDAPIATPTPLPKPVVFSVPVPVMVSTTMARPALTPQPSPSPVTLSLAPTPAPIDRRWDLLDVNVAPAYLIQNAKSRYTYRNDELDAPAVILQADAWVIPSLGFHASFISTLSGSLKDSVDGSRNVWATQQNLAIGARWRRQMSDASLSPTLVFGADWEDDQLKVPTESMLRQHLTTSGLMLTSGLEIPTTPNYAWTAELSLMPLASQTERSSAVEVSSGNHADTNALGLSVGGRYAFDHADSIYWRLTGRWQKDVYDGQAIPNDPLTGQTLSGVTITTKSLLLELGFSFGN